MVDLVNAVERLARSTDGGPNQASAPHQTSGHKG
jgi:hypothetical protein